eukprot:251073_1
MLSFIILYIHTTTAQIQQSTTVNALTQPLNGISITYNPESTKIFGTSYNISVKSQTAYDLSISLDTTWSFKPTQPTTLILTLNGNTPNPTVDSDFIIIFTVDNTQYFSFFIHLDNHPHRSRIYPYEKLAHESDILSYLQNSSIYPQRWFRVSNGDQSPGWVATNPRYNTQAQWPLQFHITNNISSNSILFSYYDKATIYETGNTFNDTFTPNTPINIYIMGDTSREQFYIHDINIQLYHDNIPTISPTNIPTISPTNTPTTNIPTTNIPTTNTPTTDIPTLFPTTSVSTSSPTDKPSHSPTFIPTKSPIMEHGVTMKSTVQNEGKQQQSVGSSNDSVLYGLLGAILGMLILIAICFGLYWLKRNKNANTGHMTKQIEMQNEVQIEGGTKQNNNVNGNEGEMEIVETMGNESNDIDNMNLLQDQEDQEIINEINETKGNDIELNNDEEVVDMINQTDIGDDDDDEIETIM